jgi:hypothetical protein
MPILFSKLIVNYDTSKKIEKVKNNFKDGEIRNNDKTIPTLSLLDITMLAMSI